MTPRTKNSRTRAGFLKWEIVGLSCVIFFLLTNCATMDQTVRDEVSLNPLLFPVTTVLYADFDLGPNTNSFQCWRVYY